MSNSKSYVTILMLISAFVLTTGFSSTTEAQPTISINSVDTTAAESGQETATFTVTRTNDANTDAVLRVYLEITGSATANADYDVTNLGGVSATTWVIDIQAGLLSRTVLITPRLDNFIENDENIVVKVLPFGDANHQYTVGSPSEVEIVISDDVAVVTMVMTDTEAAEASQDTASFTVTRNSQGNPGVTLRVYLEITGSATANADYNVTNLGGVSATTWVIDIPSNDLSKTVLITPRLDNFIENDENIVVKVLPFGDGNHQYIVGTPSQGEAIILDFRDFVFSDSFEQ